MNTWFPACCLGFFLIITFPFINIASAQNNFRKYKVLSKANSSPIPYASIAIKYTSKGTYSNESGEFSISCHANDSIAVSSVGYFSSACGCENKVIYLELQTTLLKEVIISSNHQYKTRFKLGYFDQKRVGSYLGTNAAALWIENKRAIKGQIQKVFFLLSKIKFVYDNPKPKFYQLLVRLSLNEAATPSLKPGHSILYKDIVQKISENQTKVIFDIESLNISFPENGIFIGIEFLVYYKEDKFVAFSMKDGNNMVQYKPSFAKTNDQAKSWIRVDYLNDWRLFEGDQQHIYNFNFGLEVESQSK